MRSSAADLVLSYDIALKEKTVIALLSTQDKHKHNISLNKEIEKTLEKTLNPNIAKQNDSIGYHLDFSQNRKSTNLSVQNNAYSFHHSVNSMRVKKVDGKEDQHNNKVKNISPYQVELLDPEGYFTEGKSYLFDQGQVKNYKLAVENFEKSILSKDYKVRDKAYYYIGRCYCIGDTYLQQDIVTAIQYLEKARLSQDTETKDRANLYLGICYNIRNPNKQPEYDKAMLYLQMVALGNIDKENNQSKNVLNKMQFQQPSKNNQDITVPKTDIRNPSIPQQASLALMPSPNAITISLNELEQIKKQVRQNSKNNNLLMQRFNYPLLHQAIISNEDWIEIQKGMNTIRQVFGKHIDLPHFKRRFDRQFSKQYQVVWERITQKEMSSLKYENQLKQIEQDPALQDYYYTLLTTLNATFSAASTIYSSMVEHNVSTKTGLAITGLGALAKHSGLPGGSAVSSILETAWRRSKKPMINRLANFFHGDSMAQATFIKQLATELTLQQRDFILSKPDHWSGIKRCKWVKNKATGGDIDTPVKAQAADDAEHIIALISTSPEKLKTDKPLPTHSHPNWQEFLVSSTLTKNNQSHKNSENIIESPLLNNSTHNTHHNVLNASDELENDHSLSQNQLNNRVSTVENKNKQMFQYIQNIVRTTSEQQNQINQLKTQHHPISHSSLSVSVGGGQQQQYILMNRKEEQQNNSMNHAIEQEFYACELQPPEGGGFNLRLESRLSC